MAIYNAITNCNVTIVCKDTGAINHLVLYSIQFYFIMPLQLTLHQSSYTRKPKQKTQVEHSKEINPKSNMK